MVWCKQREAVYLRVYVGQQYGEPSRIVVDKGHLTTAWWPTPSAALFIERCVAWVSWPL